MKIKVKIFLLILIPLIFFLIIHGYSHYKINKSNEIYNQIISSAIKDSGHAIDIRFYTLEISKVTDQALLSSDQEEIEDLFDEYKELAEKRKNSLDELKSSASDGSAEFIYPTTFRLVKELEEQINIYEELRQDLFSALINGSNKNIAGLVKEILLIEGKVISRSTIISRFFIDKSEGVSLLIEQERIKNSILLYSWSILIVVIIVIILMIANKMLIDPIKKLTNVINKLKNGSLKARVNLNTNDELEKFGDVLNKSISRIENIESLRKNFLSIISHEMRNYITPINLNLELLLEKKLGRMNNEQRKTLKAILSNTNLLNKIIIDLLDISRIENAKLEFNFEKVDIKDLIEKIVEFHKPAMGRKKIKPFIHIEKVPIIKADPRRISQVINNLLDNAIKFNRNKGAIRISAKMQKDYILFSISDTGIGIPASKQRQIFNPFFQVHSIRKGLGLGLSLCKGIIEMQSGRIWFKSRVGKGTVFNFTMPIKPVKNIKKSELAFA
ncbi:HAMP domain-containing histidine kinase [Candidatus Woesearchaeota archaeon]|nr:HAMP domain-containing histidine kinase [Candidatus Woesearchaeota archaeon]